MVLLFRPGHIRIHRLLKLVPQDSEVACNDLVSIVQVVCNLECWDMRIILILHCAHVIDHVTEQLTVESTSWLSKHTRLVVLVNKAYGALGQPGKQKELLERALRIQKAHHGPDHYSVGCLGQCTR
jgi:hypothetical protein